MQINKHGRTQIRKEKGCHQDKSIRSESNLKASFLHSNLLHQNPPIRCFEKRLLLQKKYRLKGWNNPRKPARAESLCTPASISHKRFGHSKNSLFVKDSVRKQRNKFAFIEKANTFNNLSCRLYIWYFSKPPQVKIL